MGQTDPKLKLERTCTSRKRKIIEREWRAFFIFLRGAARMGGKRNRENNEPLKMRGRSQKTTRSGMGT